MKRSIFISYISVIFLTVGFSASAGDYLKYIGKDLGDNTQITAIDTEDGDTAVILAKILGSSDSYQSMADRACERTGFDFASAYKTKSVGYKADQVDLNAKNMTWGLDPSRRTGEEFIRVWENYVMFKEVICEGGGPVAASDTHKNSDGTVSLYSHKGNVIFFVTSNYFDETDPKLNDAPLGSVQRHADHLCRIKVGTGYKATLVGKIKSGFSGVDGYELERDTYGTPELVEKYRSDFYSYFTKIVCSEKK